METYLPDSVNNGKTKEYFELIKKRAKCQLSEIINDEDKTKDIEQVNEVLRKFTTPQIFHGLQSAELLYEKNFSELCLWIELRTGINPQEKTTLEFYQLIGLINKNHGRQSH